MAQKEKNLSEDKVMTGSDFENLAAAHWAGKNSWDEFSPAEQQAILEKREQVRLACIAEYSTVPEHQARAAKNPDYWKTFSIGRHNM